MKLQLNTSKYLPNLKTYVESRAAVEPIMPGFSAIIPGLFLSIPLTIFTDISFWQAAVAAGLTTLIGGNAIAWLINRKKPRLPAETKATLARFNETDIGKLHRRIDGSAAKLLEAGAYYWVQIHSLMESETWKSSPHFQGLRLDISAAADRAMDELAGLGAICMGTANDSRSKDFKKAFENLSEGDIKEALEDFAEAFTASGDKYNYNSPHISTVFPAARAIAEKLKLLASEVATTTVENERQRLQTGAVPSSTLGGMDAVMNSLKATRVAQDELDAATDELHRL